VTVGDGLGRSWAGRLRDALGLPGLLIGLLSLASAAFGLLILAGERDRLRQTGRDALRGTLASWARSSTVDDNGRTLGDYAESWRDANPADRPAKAAALASALANLGQRIGPDGGRLALVEPLALELSSGPGAPIAAWRRRGDPRASTARIPLIGAGRSGGPAVDLVVSYRAAPEVATALAGLETSYRRLFLAVIGLSGYAVLCFASMVLHAVGLRDRAARAAAQQATLDLADRTCHELGNVAYVLSNERRNLADYLDLIDRYLDESPAALATAARRAGIDSAASGRLAAELGRELAARGIDPGVEIASTAGVARDVCRQIGVGSEYVAMTVRELDGYLRRSSLPVEPAPVAVLACVDDAIALLGPRLDAAGTRVERPEGPGPRAMADRRLVVHALVNLLKNAVEAAGAAGRPSTVRIAAEASGPTTAIVVADDGPGMSPEVLARIFEPGFTTKGAGRGRGLAVVRESIAAQGGRVRASSAPGVGTTFRIELPAAPPAA